MTFPEFIKIVSLLPLSRKHLLLVCKRLQSLSYDKLIKESFTANNNREYSIKVRVKSYFWASRWTRNCDCLPRSIALYQHLKSIGMDVEHKFGVNKKDKNIAAHAWVEYQNKPLNESKDLYQKFRVLK